MRTQLLATTSMVNPIPLTNRLEEMMWPPMTVDPEEWAQNMTTFGTAVLIRPYSMAEAEDRAKLRDALTAMIGHAATAMLLPGEALPMAGPAYGRGKMLAHPLLEPTVPKLKMPAELPRR